MERSQKYNGEDGLTTNGVIGIFFRRYKKETKDVSSLESRKKQARKLQDAQAEKLTRLQAYKLTS